MKSLDNFGHFFRDIWFVFSLETRRIFTDTGVLLIFFVAGLTYPLFFNLVYHDEAVLNLPVAVVDESRSMESRRFTHKLNATPELNVAYKCNNMAEAKYLMTTRKVNGVFYFPRDYAERLSRLETARIGVFCDMSSFLYYKGVLMGANYVMLDEVKNIQLERYEMTGLTGELADVMVKPMDYDDVKLYGRGGGFTSFLIPALLVLVIHQTLFFGIGMLGGGAREDKIELDLMPEHLRNRSVYRVVLGRALAYIVTYLPLLAIDLLLIPYLFGMPHLGSLGDLSVFMIPFILATIFFSMMVSVLIKERETGLLTMVFFSVILLFLSGFAWPRSNFPAVWRWLSYIIPSTHGIQGYIRINSLGATLPQVAFEYGALWVQTGVYFVGACLAMMYINKNRPLHEKAQVRREMMNARIKEGVQQIKERRQEQAE